MGTRGVPAKYGGFETAVEEISKRLVGTYSTSVYCRDRGATTYLGIRRIAVPAINSTSLETISRTLMSTLHAIFVLRPKVVFLMNSANAVFIPLLKLSGIKVIAHVDGLEWQRPKWSGFKSKYSMWAEKRACNWADEVIADSKAIKRYILETHNVEAVYVSYGVEPISIPPETHAEIVCELSSRITWKNFFLVVARWEPENHVAEIISAYIQGKIEIPLVVVGDSNYASTYSDAIRESASLSENVLLLGSIWDKETLDALYCGAKAYIHGHSVGGTNPSLLRAIGANAELIIFDCEFNRETANDSGVYWKDQKSLIAAISNSCNATDKTHQHKMKLNSWDETAKLYSELAKRVISSPSRTTNDWGSSA